MSPCQRTWTKSSSSSDIRRNSKHVYIEVLMLALPSRDLYALRRALLGWYDAHHRALTWPRDADTYRVWVSQIMLKQTRVAAELENYARWMRRFPSVDDLAKARKHT